MPGDHLDMPAVHRAELRRQARQVQRDENEKAPWDGDEALWITASHLPKSLAARRTLRLVAPGCYQVETASFLFLWIAANELPLAEELIPFLITRSGSALDAFGRWVKGRRAPEWLLRMVEFLSMSTAVYDELIRFATLKPVDQAMRARQQHAAKVLLENTPEVREEVVGEARKEALDKGIKQGRKQGIKQGLGPLVHQFERRLGRKLSAAERRTLQEQLDRLGPERLGDLPMDLEPEQLAVWLRDADAR